MRYVTPQRARQRLLPDAEICGAAVSWRCSSMPVVRCLSHLRQLLVREGNTDGTIAQALTFHRTNPRLLTTSRGWRPTENEYEDASTPTLAEASMSTLQTASIQALWFPLP